MATQNPTLTEKSVKALKPKASVYRVRDGIADPALKGFGVVVAPSGTKSFFMAYTSPESGKRTQGTLGIHPTLSLAKARDLARQWRQCIREGVDPVLANKREKESVQEAHNAAEDAKRREKELGTVEQLFALYITDLEADGKRSANFVRAIYNKNIGPALGEKKARDVTTEHAADLIADIAARGALVLANRVRSYCIAAYNFGTKARNLPRWRRKAPEFDLDGNPFASTEKALQREKRGQRYLSRDEVREVWKALGEPFEVNGGHGAKRMVSLDLATQIAIKLLLSTGQRVEEVFGASWSEFDFEQKLWEIPAGRRKNAWKNTSGEPHLVPLTDFHIALLEALKPFSEGSQFLFPAKVKPGEKPRPRDYRSLSQATTRLCARTGIEKFSPRDCRRTFKTLGGSIEIDLEIRHRLQGHSFDDIGSAAYDRFSYLPQKRRGMERWTAFLESLLRDEDNVVPMVREAQR